MSQENVDHVRQAYVAFAEEGVEAAVLFAAPDAVIYSLPGWPDDAE